MTDLIAYGRGFLADVTAALAELDLVRVTAVVELLGEAWRARRVVCVLGNGGSAATASHLVSDLSAAGNGAPGFRVIGLTDNVPLLTSLANDVSYEDVFARRVDQLVAPGDLVIAISGSGASENVLRALVHARARGAVTVGILGFEGGRARELVDHDLTVSSRDHAVVESVHAALEHLLATALRLALAETRPTCLPSLFGQTERSQR